MNTLLKIKTSIVLACASLISTPVFATGDDFSTDGFADVVNIFWKLLTILLSVGAAFSVVAAIFSIWNLVKSGDNMPQRKQAIQGLLSCGIVLMCIGGFGLIARILITLLFRA